MTYIVKQQQISKFMFGFITFMLEDEHRLSLGMLMHENAYMNFVIYCYLIRLIYMFLDVIYMFYNVLWGFSTNPLSLVYNSVEQETPVFGIFTFQGPYGRQTDLGFFGVPIFPGDTI